MARPERWLRLIHRYRGTLTAAPNFAYAYCSQHLDEASLAGLDLSSLQFAFCGAKPVSAVNLRSFSARFGRYDFDERAVTPVYGLAENTLGVSFPRPGRGLHVDRIQRSALGASGQPLAAPSGEGALEVVGCGEALDRVEGGSWTRTAENSHNVRSATLNFAVRQQRPDIFTTQLRRSV